MSGDEQFRAWAEIDYSIRTVRTAFDKVFGKPVFDYLGDHPDKAAIFDAAMTGIHGRESNALLDAYEFSVYGTIADIGGGNGSQISSILQKHTSMKGILFDLPTLSNEQKSGLRRRGLRIGAGWSVEAFLSPFPKGRTHISCGTSSMIGMKRKC